MTLTLSHNARSQAKTCWYAQMPIRRFHVCSVALPLTLTLTLTLTHNARSRAKSNPNPNPDHNPNPNPNECPRALLYLVYCAGRAQSCFLTILRIPSALLTRLAPASCTLNSIPQSGTSPMHMRMLL